jgi:iron complex transport system substrate-binding protein
MHKTLRPICIVLALALFSACSSRDRGDGRAVQNPGENAAPEAADLYWKRVSGPQGDWIVDRMGNTIPLTRYHRIVVISPGAVETLYLIGAEDSILAIPQNREPIWPEEKTALLPTIGNQARPDQELIVSLEPDLIIGNTMNVSLVEDFSRRGYRAIIHGAYRMDDIFNSALLMGMLTGREAAAERLVADKRAKLSVIKTELEGHPLRLKGAFLYAANPVMAFTGATLAGEILRILGTENIAEGLDAAQPILSPEYILTENPDFLFGSISLRTPEDVLAADPVIAQTKAGRKMHIRTVPSSLFLRSSPRIVENLLELYKAVKEFSQDL